MLPRRKVLNRALELKNELKAFFKEEGNTLFDQLDENDWWAKLAYLADISSRLNMLSASTQEGGDENILMTTDEMTAF